MTIHLDFVSIFSCYKIERVRSNQVLFNASIVSADGRGILKGYMLNIFFTKKALKIFNMWVHKGLQTLRLESVKATAAVAFKYERVKIG